MEWGQQMEVKHGMDQQHEWIGVKPGMELELECTGVKPDWGGGTWNGSVWEWTGEKKQLAEVKHGADLQQEWVGVKFVPWRW